MPQSLQRNSSSFWNSLSPTASSASIRILYKVRGCSHGFTCLPCHCKYLLGTLWILAIPTSPTLIKWWSRYIDDVHSATRKDQVNKLQEHLNSIDPHIKFTTELPGTNGLPFLDNLTKPTSNSIESTFYRKPIHTDRYLEYNSYHPISAKLSVIHTLIHKAKRVIFYTWISCKRMEHFTKFYKTTTTQQIFTTRYNKANPNRQPKLSKWKFIKGTRVVIPNIKGLCKQ